MNENIIAWNVTNWVTVILMAAIGFFIVGAILKWKSARVRPVSVDTTTAGPASLA